VSVDGKPLTGEVALKPEGRGGGTKLSYDGGKGQITSSIAAASAGCACATRTRRSG
jgi:hypothetical protein